MMDSGFNGVAGGIGGNNTAVSHTSCWQSGRSTYIPFNAIPSLLNMTRSKALSIIYLYNFQIKCG